MIILVRYNMRIHLLNRLAKMLGKKEGNRRGNCLKRRRIGTKMSLVKWRRMMSSNRPSSKGSFLSKCGKISKWKNSSKNSRKMPVKMIGSSRAQKNEKEHPKEPNKNQKKKISKQIHPNQHCSHKLPHNKPSKV